MAAYVPDVSILQEADAFIDAHWEEIVEGIGRLIAVPSVVDFDAATPEHPSGKEAHDGLNAAVDLARRLGFEATDNNGNVGVAVLPGERPETLAMICHADVVQPGIGWTVDPWTLMRRDGFLIGRGVVDDKGPLAISLYCMKFFTDRGIRLPYTMHMIMGANEEVGTMQDVAFYLEKYGAPAFTFTPDDMFPVCYGEKGCVNAEVASPAFEDGVIVDFTTGESSLNAVPSMAALVVRHEGSGLPDTDRVTVTEENVDGIPCARIVAHGRGGHASMPEGTVNAIGLACDYALGHRLVDGAEADFLRLVSALAASTDGAAAGIDCSDAHFDPLTGVIGTVRTEGARVVATLDIRFPTATTADAIMESLRSVAAAAGADARFVSGRDPFVLDPESPVVRTLAQAYRDATELDGEPFTIGGGTYARAFPCAASFGVLDPHDDYPDWVGQMHGADEGIAEETLKRAMRVYILTIDRLMGMDLNDLSA